MLSDMHDKKDVNFGNDVKYVFDVSISQGFEIDSLIEFHDLFENFTNFLKQGSKSKKKILESRMLFFRVPLLHKDFLNV